MHEYLKRQALTIGIKPKEVYKPVWVPNLPEAEGDCLGVLRDSYTRSEYPKIAILPDRKQVVTGHGNGKVKVWNLEDGSILWKDEDVHNEEMSHISISPDGKRIASTAYGTNAGMGIWDAVSGEVISTLDKKFNMVAWSPDNRHLVAATDNVKPLQIWDTVTRTTIYTFLDSKTGTAVAWSSDGAFIANENTKGTLDIIHVASKTVVHSIKIHEPAFLPYLKGMVFSPDTQHLAVGSKNCLHLIAPSVGEIQFKFEAGIKGWVYGIAWSPDSKYVAATGFYSKGTSDKHIHIWEAHTGQKVKEFAYPENHCNRLSWSSDGGYIASSHNGDVFRLWDVRDLQSPKLIQEEENADSALPFELRSLPDTLIQLHRLGIFPPLSLVQDLLTLLGGQTLSGPLAPIGRTLRPLIKLRWPAPARIGLLALILHRIDFRDQWVPPSGASLTELRQGLTSALKGTDVEPEPPPPPIAQLTEACTFSDQLITLLHLLGPEAVAKEPGLPLALLASGRPPAGQHPARPPAPRPQGAIRRTRRTRHRTRHQHRRRRRLRHRKRPAATGLAVATSHTARPPRRPVSLPPLHGRTALPLAREVAEPPQLRPVVLLLDDSPSVYGKVEQVTRLAAFVVGRTLQEEGLPSILVTTAGTLRELHGRSDLVEIFTSRTTRRASASKSLKMASALRAHLKGEGPDPVILLLTHPWFGEGEEVEKVKGLRGLFVSTGRALEEPVLAAQCERYSQVRGIEDLGSILGELVG